MTQNNNVDDAFLDKTIIIQNMTSNYLCVEVNTTKEVRTQADENKLKVFKPVVRLIVCKVCNRNKSRDKKNKIKSM